MTPKVSIVTTVYERVECLDRCLRSVRHLTFQDYEQIVVSDAPPDETVAAIDTLVHTAGHRVRHLRMSARTNNWGIGPAELGLRECRGEYVCFLSDDNAYLPDHFGPLVQALDHDPDLGFVYSSCLYDNRRELRYTPPIGAGIDLGQPLFRRSVLRDVCHDTIPCKVMAWDWELINYLMANGARWQHVDQLTFVFRLMSYPSLVQALA